MFEREGVIMLKRYIVIISIGCVVWIVSNTCLYPMITTLVIKKEYPVFLNDIYFLCVYLVIGFFMGWFARSKGWLLALIFGATITVFFISVSLISGFLEVEIENMGYAETVKSLVRSYALFTFYLVLGGFFGGQVRQWRKSRKQNVTS